MARFPFLALLAALPAMAAEPVVVDVVEEETEAPGRCAPAIACSAKLAATDLVAVEAGSDGRTGDGELIHGGQMIARYTLGAGVEFQVYSDTLYLPGTDPRSSEAVQPGLKFSLLPETALRPSYDMSVHLTMPTWHPDTTWDFEAWAYFSKTVGALKTDFNMMVAVSDLDETAQAHGMGTLTLTLDAGHGVNLFTEAYATFGATQALPPGGGVFSGVSIAATDSLVFDVGAEVGYHDEARYTVFAGLTWVPGGQQRPQPSRPSATVTHLAAN